MRYGLGLNWMGILFAILISVTFGFAFNSVQSNTICAAMQGSFGFDPRIVGAVLTVLTLAIIFGGIQRIAKSQQRDRPRNGIGIRGARLGGSYCSI